MSKKDLLYEVVLSRLLAGNYKFGERIFVKELCIEMSVSRQPAMAAINALSADGFVHVIPQVGCEVINPSLRDISDFYRMFAAMEGLLAELAAARRTPEQLTALREADALIRHDVEVAGARQYRELNRAFHEIFHGMASSPLLDQRQSKILAMSDFFIVQSVGFRPHTRESIEKHEDIINTIALQDCAAARRVAEEHSRESSAFVLEAARKMTARSEETLRDPRPSRRPRSTKETSSEARLSV